MDIKLLVYGNDVRDSLVMVEEGQQMSVAVGAICQHAIFMGINFVKL